MSTNDGVLVHVEGVDKTFHRGSEEIHILSDLDLVVSRGEFLALTARVRGQARRAGIRRSDIQKAVRSVRRRG